MIKIKTDESIGSIKNTDNEIKEVRYEDAVVWQKKASEIKITLETRVQQVRTGQARYTGVGSIVFYVNDERIWSTDKKTDTFIYTIKAGDKVSIGYNGLNRLNLNCSPVEYKNYAFPTKDTIIICELLRSTSGGSF